MGSCLHSTAHKQLKEIPVPAEVREAVLSRGRKELVIGLRPENMSLKEEEGEYAIRGKVFMVELLGRDKLVDFRFGDVSLRVLVPADLPIATGEELWIHPHKNRLHVFDKETSRTVPVAV
jgi:ABC-type sugar transport system ATPase subunit